MLESFCNIAWQLLYIWWALLWAKEYRPSKLFHVGAETGIQITCQPMDPLGKMLPDLLLNYPITMAPASSSDTKLWPSSGLLQQGIYQKSWSKVQALAGIVEHLPVHEAQQVLDSAGHMGTNTFVQHVDPLMGYFLLIAVQSIWRVPQHFCVLRVT